MNNHKTILCVGIPTLEEVGKFGLGFADSLGFLENCAFLQQKLAGIWEISHTGEGRKLSPTSVWSDAGKVLYLELRTTKSVGELRIHYQYIEDCRPTTNVNNSVGVFDLSGYPKGHPSKLEIGAIKVDGDFIPTYHFV